MVGFSFWVQPHEGKTAVIPATAENASPSRPQVINVNYGSDEIDSAKDRWPTSNANSAGCRPFNRKTDLVGQPILHVFGFAADERQMSSHNV
ncbi:MAG: hypothetical protein WBD95_25720, partial [Xanthobacteraceae bacterium]